MANTVGGLIRPGEGGEPSPNNIHPATVRHPASTCTACDIGPARLPSLPCTWLPSLPVGKSAADPRHAIGLRDGFGGGGKLYVHRPWVCIPIDDIWGPQSPGCSFLSPPPQNCKASASWWPGFNTQLCKCAPPLPHLSHLICFCRKLA